MSNVNSLHVQIFEANFPGLHTITNGVVFVHAKWSGDSILSLRRLSAALQRAFPKNVEVVVVSTDGIDFEKFTKSYGQFPSGGGRGESFWIKHHSVVNADGGFYKVDSEKLLEERIAQFADKCK